MSPVSYDGVDGTVGQGPTLGKGPGAALLWVDGPGPGLCGCPLYDEVLDTGPYTPLHSPRGEMEASRGLVTYLW